MFSKLFASIFVSFIILAVLFLTSFITTTLLFGFFTIGAYSSSADTMLTFTAGLIQIITTFFTTIFYSTTIICLFLITNSLSGALVGVVLLKGLGEVISRSLSDKNNLLLSFSPLGVLNILNPVSRNISIISYTIQLLLTVIYSIVIFYIAIKLFEKKEF